MTSMWHRYDVPKGMSYMEHRMSILDRIVDVIGDDISDQPEVVIWSASFHVHKDLAVLPFYYEKAGEKFLTIGPCECKVRVGHGPKTRDYYGATAAVLADGRRTIHVYAGVSPHNDAYYNFSDQPIPPK